MTAIRKSIYFFMMIVFANTLFAADLFVATWKLSPAKSKYPDGTVPKDETVVVAEQGENIQVTVSGTNADGSPMSIKYTVPQKGGPGHVQEGPFDGVSWKVISAHVREISSMKDGKQISSHRGVMSKGGKTLRVTVNGNDAHGNPIQNLRYSRSCNR